MRTNADDQAASNSATRRATVRIEFGRRWLPAEQAEQLDVGAVVALEAGADQHVDVYVDGTLVARGEPIVLDGKLAVRLREVLSDQGSSSDDA